MMKIAVVRKECGYRRGGAERYCANLCLYLADMGHRVYVVGRECDDDIHPDLIHVPVSVSNRTSAARNLSFHHNSQRALKDLDVDRVFALSRTYPADAFRVSDPLHDSWLDIRYPGRLRNCMERLNPRHRAILALEKGICDARHTGAIITNSAWSRERLLERYDYPSDRIHVVYNGVDLERFRPLRKDPAGDGPLRLLFVAQDFLRKGLGFILQTLSQLAVEGINCQLTVVGRDDPKPFRKQADQLGVGRHVVFVGPTRRIEDYYNASDLLVFPTLSDPFANVCLEALACGLPVMTTTSNGAAEILDEVLIGYVLQADRSLVPQMTAGIARFSRLSREQRLKMGRRARLSAEAFTIERNAQRTLEVLTRLRRPGASG
jgi:UDP-glucose:(heptosyl)LPS alpha-1,3-glucosyltransferase